MHPFYLRWQWGSVHVNPVYSEQEILLMLPEEAAKKGRWYKPICARLFEAVHIERSASTIPRLFFNDLSGLDEMILGRLLLYSFTICRAMCHGGCPGFSVIPVEPFLLPGIGGPVKIRCRRRVPQKMLREGWKKLKEYADHHFAGYRLTTPYIIDQ